MDLDHALGTHLGAVPRLVLEPGGELWCVWNSPLNYRPILDKLIGSTKQVQRTTKFTVTSDANVTAGRPRRAATSVGTTPMLASVEAMPKNNAV